MRRLVHEEGGGQEEDRASVNARSKEREKNREKYIYIYIYIYTHSATVNRKIRRGRGGPVTFDVTTTDFASPFLLSLGKNGGGVTR